MLIPATQPGSDLGYVPEPEIITLTFKSDAPLQLYVPGTKMEQSGGSEISFTVTPAGEGKLLPFTAKLTTPATSLHVSFHTSRDKRPRALPTRRFLLPFARPAETEVKTTLPAEIVGGNWDAGRTLFKGKATCATCHRLRGEGMPVGPDLGNLVHRDYHSVLTDIAEPNAAINPDAAGYLITTRDSVVMGTRLSETADELQIAQAGGAVAKLRKSEIVKTEPMAVSLMPPGLDKTLTQEELRDLMTYLLSERPLPTGAR
jgi:putative heme-binding domain-containing protein